MSDAIPFLIGAVVGAGAAVMSSYIQSRVSARIERARVIFDIARQEQTRMIEQAQRRLEGGRVLPIALMAWYHAQVYDLINRGKFTKEAYEELGRRLKDEMVPLATRSGLVTEK